MGDLMSKDVKELVLYRWNVIETIRILMVPLYQELFNILVRVICYLHVGKCLLSKNLVEFIITELKSKFVGNSVPNFLIFLTEKSRSF